MSQRALDPAIRETEPYRYRIVRPDGSVRWVVARGSARFDIVDGSERAVRYTGSVQDITDLHESESRYRLLLREMQHRMNNTLALVGAIAQQTFSNASDTHAAIDTFSARLAALGNAHALLAESRHRSAPIADVVKAALAPHAVEGRIAVSGPRIELSSRRVIAMLLALNELATNASKYGALSKSEGNVVVEWAADEAENELLFRWTERDGPEVVAPSRRGFGSRLVENVFPSDFNGVVEVAYPPTGVVVELRAPLIQSSDF
jgi:two-component sensor histidine kinase